MKLDPVAARLCGFDHYSGIEDDHPVEWLRRKSTLTFAIPRAIDGGQPAWRIGDEYVVVPVPQGMTVADVVLQMAGQLRMDEAASP